jgi:hypothetical protein
LETVRAESAFCVDVQRLPFASTLVNRHLAGHAQCVADLRFARPEFTKHLGDTPGFDPAW